MIYFIIFVIAFAPFVIIIIGVELLKKLDYHQGNIESLVSTFIAVYLLAVMACGIAAVEKTRPDEIEFNEVEESCR